MCVHLLGNSFPLLPFSPFPSLVFAVVGKKSDIHPGGGGKKRVCVVLKCLSVFSFHFSSFYFEFFFFLEDKKTEILQCATEYRLPKKKKEKILSCVALCFIFLFQRRFF